MVDKALGVIDTALAQCCNPYVAWSGGKDSTALLHLVQQRRPDIPAVCVQTDIELPDNLEIVERATRELRANLILVQPEVSAWQLVRRYGGPFGQVNVATSMLDRLCFFAPITQVVEERGFDAVFLGLRAEESRARLMNRRKRGLVYANKGRGLLTATPLGDWSGVDVFAYLVSRNLPISSVYSKTKFHPEPERVREGWWLPGDFMASRGIVIWLRYYYPDLYDRLAREFPEVAAHV
jgi:phosphoadenosine phosphosulfate reductase